MFNSIEEAIEDLKQGKMLIVVDDEDRENEGDLVMVAQKITPEAVNFMAMEGRGLVCAPVSAEIARRLDLTPMVEKNEESMKCQFTVSIDYKIGTSTGISAKDRAVTISALVTEGVKADDFNKPGHVFPLIARDGGVLVRAGHTEAACDLASLSGFMPAAVICEIVRDDGEMARLPDLIEFSKKHSLKIISIQDLIAYRRKNERLIEYQVSAHLPTEYGDFTMHVYTSLVDKKEHVVLQMGEVRGVDDVLTRVHSECMTGDVFHSQRCDCRAQLEAALKLIAEEGRGVLLYMRQEGRGIGLVNKLKAYNLQEQGYDTVEANQQLGFQPDLRQYGIGAQILADLGLSKIRLLTNNPRKIVGLDGYGLHITKRVPLQIAPSANNQKYLKTKRDVLGHLLDNI